jgi:GDP-mannose 6-dehydrogenase
LPQSKTITVFGLGYVGSVTAACLAHWGCRVFGIDKDDVKVNSISAGKSPFYEPGLEDLIRDSVAAGRLTASRDSEAALQASEIVMICVGTPSAPNGSLALDQLRRVFLEIGRHLATRRTPLVVAVRSTVLPGTTEELAAECFPQPSNVSLVSNPEFLREGVAVKDFMEPSLIVAGGDPDGVASVAALYSGLGVETCRVSLRCAEMIKYSANAFHALKIAFANEMSAVADSLYISAEEVMDVLCRDVRLNISSAYLKPGFAFGGSCLPKDLRALNHRAIRLELKLPLVDSILVSNERHLERAVRNMLNLPARRIGVFGLAFKENTDDLRESPIISAIEQLIGKGREVRIFDPRIQLESIYGSNRNYLLNVLPHIGKLLAQGLDDLVSWSECLVLAQKPSPEMRRIIEDSGITVMDVVRSESGRVRRASGGSGGTNAAA